ncbi:MAG: cell division protein ZipA [Gammaproteobacteria bacterium]|nr:cell division protein ZipA [Gammaproteobacteria bacterium]MDP2349260.1 cell division protein ZipA [Gammaproteobacteria bacterium]
MGLRELLILVLILAIVGVIVRGLYVALRARRGQLRMALEKNIPQYDPDEIALSELPNGGARLVERSFAHVVRQNSEFSSRDKLAKGKGDQAIPVLMDSVGDDDDEEDVSPVRNSSVANARQAARQRHSTLGSKVVLTPKPTHRPIDVMPARTAAIPTAAAASVSFAGEESARSYEDPLDNHVFKDEVEAPSETGSYEDDAYDEESFDENDDDTVSYDERDEWPETEPDDTLDALDIPDDLGVTVSSQPLVPDDLSSEPFAGQPFTHRADDEDDYIDDEDFDDDDLLDEEEALDDQTDDLDNDDDSYNEDLDDDEYEEYLDEDEIDSSRSLNDVQDDFEDDAEDEELEAEEFDSVYGDDRNETRAPLSDDDTYDDYDDEGDDLDDYPDEDEEVKSGPRSWLQWAGDKISGMTSAAISRGEREREKDAIERLRKNERAEPMIGGNSFDDSMMEDTIPAPTAPTPAPRSKPEPLHKSRQSELNLDDPLDSHDEADDDDYDEPRDRLRGEPRPERVSPGRETLVPVQPETKPPAPSVPADYSEVLVLNVVAKQDREFAGVDLLPVLLTTGLRFGDMNIFHRHLDNDTRAPVLFSVANIVNPGTFDLNQINDFATRGLCFFMTLPNVANSMQAFDLMLDVAQQVRIALDGDLKDDNRSVMTAQTIEHYRQRVRDFDLRQLRQQK